VALAAGEELLDQPVVIIHRPRREEASPEGETPAGEPAGS
jgi:hypothetical protein